MTATRTPKSKRDIAAGIDSISAEKLLRVSAIHPSEVLNSVSGVNIHRGSGQEHLTAIRSPVLTGGSGAGSFLYLEDGVPLRAAGFSNINGLFESGIEYAEKVEVSKGPGSALYGSNAVHGLVNVLSRQPTQKRTTYVDALFNNRGTVSLKTSLSGPVSSGQIRLSASLVNDDGWREQSGFAQQKIQLRYDTSFSDWSVNSVLSVQNLEQETAGFVQGELAYRDKILSQQNAFPEAFRDARSARLHSHFVKDISTNSRLNITPYVRWTKLNFLRHFVPGQALEENGHKSLGVMNTYYKSIGQHELILGFDAEFTQGYLQEFQPGPSVFSFVTGEHYDYSVDNSVLSTYLSSQFSLQENTKLILEVRADYTDYQYDNQIDTAVVGRFQRVADRSDAYFIITPKIGMTHQFSPNVSSYLRLARGSRAPQASDLYSLQINQVPGEISVETLDVFEVGLAAKLMNIDLNVDAYLMRKNNFFFRNANGFNVVNGKTKHKGLELGIASDLSDQLNISANLSFAEHTYDFTEQVASASSSITRGDQVDSAPRQLANVLLNYQNSDDLSFGLEWRRVGSYFTDPGNTHQYDGHDVFVLRGNFKFKNDVSLYARVDNLFDTRYADRADFAFGNERYFPGAPRTLLLGIRSGL